MEPYKFKQINFNDGFLNNSVDATYIIHLENNGRYNHIQKQLSEYHPTDIVYILFNKGYKNSIKKPFINKSYLDLVDAFLEVFKHANKKKYNNILILEDDFIFSDKIKETKHINNLNNSIKNLGDKDFIYLLGCLPYLSFPCSDNKYYNFNASGMHAVIYSYKNRIKTLGINQEDIIDWDIYNRNFDYFYTFNKDNLNRYMYKIPLCYQLFPDTENKKNWYQDNNIINYILISIFKLCIKILGLDKHYEPGYTIYYFYSKYLMWIIILTLIISIIILMIIKN